MCSAKTSYNIIGAKDIIHELLSILFPAYCIHCNNILVGQERFLCTECLIDIPWSHHAFSPNNECELRLIGRVNFEAAASLMTFAKGNVVQSIVHQIKYHGNTRLAHQFGHLLGEDLVNSGRFGDIDYIVPVPLHWWRQMRRGYNQSTLICEGIAEVMHIPIVTRNLYRKRYTNSQTKKSRHERLSNMHDVFDVRRPEQFYGKHILLVDDILTTGATTESCYHALSCVPNLRVSIATLAYAYH